MASVHDDMGNWRKPALRGAAVVALTFGVMGGWSATARVDSAVVASGVVAVETDRKPVQHLEGGIVHALLVADGQRVAQGQVLLRIEPTQSRAQADLARNAVAGAAVEAARLEAEVAGRDAFRAPGGLAATVGAAALGRAVADQERFFAERRSARLNEVQVLRERIAQNERQADGARASLDAAVAQERSHAAEHAKLRPLADRGIVAANRMEGIERNRIEQAGRAQALAAEVERLERANREARLQVDGVARKFAEEAAGKLGEARVREADARERLRVAEDVLARSEVRSPRAGRVVGLKVHAAGAVAKAGETMMEIVPEDDALVVSARISPNDVAHVHPGLAAQVRFPSLHDRTQTVAVGEVLSVGADALRDEATRQPYYDLRVSVQVAGVPGSVRERLRPGLPAEVVAATGERTVVEYLAKPLSDALRRGMREQ